MATYTLDTAAAVRRLKSADCQEPLAEAIVSLVAEREEELATKSDLRELKTELKGDIAALKAELKADNATLSAQLTKRLALVVVLIVSCAKALDFLFPVIGG